MRAKAVSMNRKQRRAQKRTVRPSDARSEDPADRPIATNPSSEAVGESKPDPYRDEGGES
jgi:hypothetical protein